MRASVQYPRRRLQTATRDVPHYRQAPVDLERRLSRVVPVGSRSSGIICSRIYHASSGSFISFRIGVILSLVSTPPSSWCHFSMLYRIGNWHACRWSGTGRISPAAMACSSDCLLHAFLNTSRWGLFIAILDRSATILQRHEIPKLWRGVWNKERVKPPLPSTLNPH
jgi:hypothetical protein